MNYGKGEGMKSAKKIGIIVLISIILVSFMSIDVNASANLSTGSLVNKAKTFVGNGQAGTGNVNTSVITSGVTSIASILVTIGAFILVILTIILGIQYMTSPPQKQAALRSQMIGLLWAYVVVFGAYGIWNIAVNIVQTF